MNWLEKKINTQDDGDIGCFVDVDLKYPVNMKEKTKRFPFCPENKKLFLKKNIMII